jgi:hypothetical protein
MATVAGEGATRVSWYRGGVGIILTSAHDWHGWVLLLSEDSDRRDTRSRHGHTREANPIKV